MYTSDLRVCHSLFARLLDRGVVKGVDCLIYPLYGQSLERVLDDGRVVPLPRCQIREISYQVVAAIGCEFILFGSSS